MALKFTKDGSMVRFRVKLTDKKTGLLVDSFHLNETTEREAENHCLNVIAGIDTDIDRNDIDYDLTPDSLPQTAC